MSPRTTGLGRFLTPADAAQILAVPLSTVLDLIDSGEIPAIRIGATGRLRLKRAALDAYIDELYDRRRREMAWHEAGEQKIVEIAGGSVVGRAQGPRLGGI
ncbi:MAG TPA: helix-turn-helix domain-containing protein [Microbacteriaceae bacterium]|nr:helix-turn-helix domain-containing protein [Microbacteriaceae bacterium]